MVQRLDSNSECDLYKWLENWELGFDRSDPSTHKAANLPFPIRGGVNNR
jgi:hypothetical protein